MSRNYPVLYESILRGIQSMIINAKGKSFTEYNIFHYHFDICQEKVTILIFIKKKMLQKQFGEIVTIVILYCWITS